MEDMDTDIDEVLSVCEDAARLGLLSNWEYEFVESVSEQYGCGNDLSDRQLSILMKIYFKCQ